MLMSAPPIQPSGVLMKPHVAAAAACLLLALTACVPADVDAGGSGTKPMTGGTAGAAAPAGADGTGTEPASSPPAPAVRPQDYKGRGDKVLRIKDGEEVMLATFTHSGNANFIVGALGESGAEGESLVNEIGRYKGTVLFNVEEGTFTRALKI